MSGADAHAKGLRVKVNAASVPNWFTARRLNEAVYGYEVIIEEDTDAILGAHIVGPGADEVIKLFTSAIRIGLTTQTGTATMFACPTAASDVGYMLA